MIMPFEAFACLSRVKHFSYGSLKKKAEVQCYLICTPALMKENVIVFKTSQPELV
jgi:hypothetical protein